MKRAYLSVALLTGAAALSPAALAQTTTDWTGFYVGGTIGKTFKSDTTETVVFDTDRDGVFDDTVLTTGAANAFSPGFCEGAAQGATPLAGCRFSDDQFNYSFRAGYDLQFGDFVVGALGEYAAQNIGEDVTAFSTTPASYTFARDLNAVMSLRARGGYVFGPSLIYATAGMAWADMEHTFTTTNGANTFTPSGGEDVEGFQAGAGYETQLDAMGLVGWTVGVEYLFTQLDVSDYQVAVGPGTAPATNPFLLVDPTGTDMKRTKEDFEFGSLGATLAWRM